MKVSGWYGSLNRKKLYRTHGDLARDRQAWAEAETAYERHLDTVPGDFGIWVQYGHALKEQGKLAKAEQAYRRALSLAPDDQDVCTHLAHLLKRMGDKPEAARMFARLFQADGGREPYGELVRLPSLDAADETVVRTGRTVPGDALFIELDDLLGFLEAHKTVSGIQRVQLGVIQHVLAMPDGATRHVFVLNETDSPYLWQIRSADIGAIARYLQQPDVDHDTLKSLVRKVRRNAEAVLPQRGQAYLVLGAFWGYGAVAARYAEMKRAGVAVGAYIYDLIPITNTEYCDEGLPHEFKLSFGDGLAVFDFILAISEFSANEVRRYIERLGLPARPVVAVPLAHANDAVPRTGEQPPAPARLVAGQVPEQEPEQPRQAVRSRPLASLRGRPFAMMVSTIEARKNHTYLVAAWKHFIDEGLDPPDLVFVGRPGWRVTSLMEMLATTRYLDRRVHILHDLSDAELTALYDASLFTLFPSFVEGWGLPVGESLARGKPCIASSTSSIPEVGGDLIDYVDPYNLRDGIEVIRRMAFDVAYRTRRTEEIRSRFQPRTWGDVSANLLNQVQRLRLTLTVNTRPEVLLPAGRIFRPGDLALGNRLPDSYAVHPLRSMLATSWYGIEVMGCWMQGRRGELLFRSDLPPGTRIMIYLGLYSCGFSSPRLKLSLDVTAGTPWPVPGNAIGPAQEAGHMMAVPVGRHFNATSGGVVGADGLVRIRLGLTGMVTAESSEPRSRRFAIGLASVCYARTDNPEERLHLVERLLMNKQLQSDEDSDPGFDEDEEIENAA